jgi:tetratricopeptide (TPR) repeat protein
MDHTYDFYTGLCYLQLDKFDFAEKLFTQTIEEEKSHHRASWVHHLHWIYIGVVKYEKEECQNAISYFDNSLNIYSRFSDARCYKALCLEKLKKYK